MINHRPDTASLTEQTASASDRIRLLYVDSDPVVREETRTALESQQASFDVQCVGSVDDAHTVARSTAVDCLVVDPDGLDRPVESVLDTVDCPMLVYTASEPEAIEEQLFAEAATVVEKGIESPNTRLLAEKIASVTSVPIDRDEHALTLARTAIERRTTESEVAILFDDSDGVVWSSGPLDAVLGVEPDDGSLERDRLYSVLTDAETNDSVADLLEDGPDEAVTVRVGDDDQVRYLCYREHRLPDAIASGRLVVLRDVTETVQREAEAALLELLVDRAQDGLFTLDERGVIDFCNRSFAATLGYEVDEIRGRHASATLAPGEFATSQDSIQALLEDPDNQGLTVDQTLVRKDGTELETSIHFTLIRGSDGAYRGLVGVVRDITDRKERERNLTRYRNMVDSMSDFACMYDADGRYQLVNDALASALGSTPSELVGEPSELVDHVRTTRDGDAYGELVDGTRDEIRGEFTIDSPGNAEIVTEYRLSRLTHGDSFDGVVAVGRDVTDQRHRERELETRRDELETLTQVHVLIHEILRALGSAATRGEIEDLVCNRLVDSDLYELAWIGERDGGRTVLVPEAVAGDESYLDIVDEQAPFDRRDDPGWRAVETGEVQVIHDVTTDERMRLWREEALKRDFKSISVLPIRYESTIYGALIVYANRQEAFSDRAIDALAVLGEMVGFAFMAVGNRQLLTRDSVLELEFRSDHEGNCLVDVARQHDCRLESEGAIEIADGQLQYFSITGAPPAAVLDSFLTGAATDGRVVRSAGDSGLIELVLSETYQSRLLDVGARSTALVADAGGISITVETTPDADPRTIQETLEPSTPGIELVSRQEQTRPVETGTDASGIFDRLTDRQREVLRAAYLSGYYSWPRDTTAEELADSLDIASPTLHQHLRRAQRNLLEAMVDG